MEYGKYFVAVWSDELSVKVWLRLLSCWRSELLFAINYVHHGCYTIHSLIAFFLASRVLHVVDWYIGATTADLFSFVECFLFDVIVDLISLSHFLFSVCGWLFVCINRMLLVRMIFSSYFYFLLYYYLKIILSSVHFSFATNLRLRAVKAWYVVYLVCLLILHKICD